MTRFSIIVLFLPFILIPVGNVKAQTGPPLLEQYSFELGESGAIDLSFRDKNIQRGAAQFRINLSSRQNSYDLELEVFRHVTAGSVSFALLLERIEITFLNAGNTAVGRVVLDQSLGEGGLFIIGDSNDGYFRAQRTLRGVNSARRVTISLFGNYE